MRIEGLKHSNLKTGAPMSQNSMSPLRQRMLEDMSLRGFTPDTQRDYIRAIKKLANAFSSARSGSTLITLALRGHRLCSSSHTDFASCLLSNSLCRVWSVDHRLLLPSYQPVIVASVFDLSVME